MTHALQNKIYTISKKYGQRLGFDLPYFVKNGFWVSLRQGVGSICSLALSIAFARLATQEVFGQYQFVLSVLSIVSILSIPGLNVAIAQSVARGYDGDYKKAVKISFLWSLLGVPTLLVIGGYYYIFQSHSLGITLMISSMFFPFFYAPNTWDAFLQGKSRFDISTKYSLIQAILNMLATIGIIFFNANNLIPITVVYFISYTFFNGYYYFKSLKYIENGRSDEDTLKYGWFLTKISVAGVIAENVDKIIIGILISPAAVAVYYVISAVPLKIKDGLKPFYNLFFPKLSQDSFSIKEFLGRKKRFIFLAGLLLLGIAGIFYLFIGKINYLLFGNSYVDFYKYSKWYAIMIFFMTPVNFLGKYVFAKKETQTLRLLNVFYPFLKITVTGAFIYLWGIAGAVLASNVNMAVYFLIYLIALISNRGKSIRSL